MSQKKKDKKDDGKKKAPVHVRHYELGSGGASKEERVIRNLLVSKDVEGVAWRVELQTELEATVRAIVAENSALSLYARAALAYPVMRHQLGAALRLIGNGEGTNTANMDIITAPTKEADDTRAALAAILPDALTDFSSASIAQALLVKFAVSDRPPANHIAFHLALAWLASNKDKVVSQTAKHLAGLFSIPKRMERLRRTLAVENGIALAGSSVKEDAYEAEALTRLSAEPGATGANAQAALMFAGIAELIANRMCGARYAALTKLRDIVNDIRALPAESPEGIAARAAVCWSAKNGDRFAARIGELMESELKRDYLEKLITSGVKEMVCWMGGLAIQQQNTLAEFCDGCLEDNPRHTLAEMTWLVREEMERNEKREKTELVLLNL